MLVTVSSVRGAPGVSSWALLLATAWPHSADRVLVEADGSGGILGARYDLPLTPGTADLMSALRRGRVGDAFRTDLVGRLLRKPTGDEEALWAVPGPATGRDAQTAWSELARPVSVAMADDARLWVADCGRVWAGSPFETLLATADLNVLVSDDSVPALVATRARANALPGAVAVLVIGRAKHTVAELRDFTGTELVWKLPRYRSLAGRAGQLATDGRQGRRSKPWKAALDVAHGLAEALADLGTGPEAGSPSTPPSTSADATAPGPASAATAAATATAPTNGDGAGPPSGPTELVGP